MTNQIYCRAAKPMAVGDPLYVWRNERRSGPIRTVQADSEVLFKFFDALGKTPDGVSSPNFFSYATALAY